MRFCEFFDAASRRRLIDSVMKRWPSARHWVSAADAQRCWKLALQRICVVVCLSVTLEDSKAARRSFLSKAKECVSKLSNVQVRRACVR
jgi:hypothetical protein